MESASFVAALAMRSSGPQISESFPVREAHPLGLDVLFEYASDVFFLARDDGRFARCNRAFLSLTGRAEDEVMGARNSDFFSANLAENHMSDDRVVVRSGTSIIDRLELAPKIWFRGRR